ncbi:MAG: hypothetical protein JO092_11905 [Candidatus Eremiobacteraeota bacterium]|nr:hypothetical protein [Candidatus Eremiobacteraeota bacterium]
MKRLSGNSRLLAALAASMILISCRGPSGNALPNNVLPANRLPVQTQSVNPGIQRPTIESLDWVPRFTVIQPTDLDYEALRNGTTTTIPYYTGSIKSPLTGKTYTYDIVGKDPTKSDRTTEIPYVPIVLVVTFPDGTVLDPRLPACKDTVSVEDRFLHGPNFQRTPLVSNGVYVGKVQLNDAFQRAEFWTMLKGRGYHTELTAAAAPIVVSIKAPKGSSTLQNPAPGCSKSDPLVGLIPLDVYDPIIRALVRRYATTTQVALVLTHAVYVTQPGFIYIGYHGAFRRRSGTQVYAWATYNDPRIFIHNGKHYPVEDITTWTHEIAEFHNDPFVSNRTPRWGHVGQQSGCQSNLEVGDPLTTRSYKVVYNGFTYHPQELAFFSWFFRTPSTGTGGLYSNEGKFTTYQSLCKQ